METQTKAKTSSPEEKKAAAKDSLNDPTVITKGMLFFE